MLVKMDCFDCCPACGEDAIVLSGERAVDDWQHVVYFAHCENELCDWEGEILFDVVYNTTWSPDGDDEYDEWKATAQPRI